MRVCLKKAYLTLVKKDKGKHDSKTGLSLNGELLFALAVVNYNKAHKLKFKSTKMQHKMLRQLDGDSEGKKKNKPKEAESQKK